MSEGWEPISKADLLTLLADGERALEPKLRERWMQVRIEPEEWALPPEGDLGGGFWAVAVIGQRVVWYNDIEDGFDISEFQTRGTIGEHTANDFELHHVAHILFPDL